MKILCFTTSYKRPYFLYNTINSILNQTHKDIKYCVNINLDNLDEQSAYKLLLYDFINDDRLKIIFNINNHQHINYVKAIQGFGHTDFDLFAKIDDDDIYHTNYIEKSIQLFSKNNCDIMSYISNIHINNNIIKLEKISSIGEWHKDTESSIKFGMPSSFLFNKRACDIVTSINEKLSRSIHLYEDGAWKELWRRNKLNSKIIDDENIFTYNIHRDSTSSQFLLDKHEYNIENDYASIVYTNHPTWKSYIYLNKRNNRVYNINNNDHGSYSLSSNYLNISWDHWGKEQFKKEPYKNKNYYRYNFHKKL